MIRGSFLWLGWRRLVFWWMSSGSLHFFLIWWWWGTGGGRGRGRLLWRRYGGKFFPNLAILGWFLLSLFTSISSAISASLWRLLWLRGASTCLLMIFLRLCLLADDASASFLIWFGLRLLSGWWSFLLWRVLYPSSVGWCRSLYDHLLLSFFF